MAMSERERNYAKAAYEASKSDPLACYRFYCPLVEGITRESTPDQREEALAALETEVVRDGKPWLRHECLCRHGEPHAYIVPTATFPYQRVFNHRDINDWCFTVHILGLEMSETGN